MVGDLKVIFLDLQMRSSTAAKAHIQGAHPWVIRSNFLIRMLLVQRKVPVGDL